MKKFSTLFTGLLFVFCAYSQDASFPLEANGGFIDFTDDSNFKDTWYVGGSTGFNFTENAGLRGYYWKALDDGDISEMDQLEIYGIETKVKVPITQFAKPYLVVGGGLLKPYGDYTGDDDLPYNADKFFGSAGAGLDLSFINFLSVTGYARAMVSEFSQLDDFDENNTDIDASWNYGASINFRIGDRKNGKFISKADVPIPEAKEKEIVVEEDEIESYDKDKRIEELEERLQKLEEKIEREEELEKLRKEIREEIEREYDLSSKKKVDGEHSVAVDNQVIDRLDALNSRLDSLQAMQRGSSEDTREKLEEIEDQQQANQQSNEELIAELREEHEDELAQLRSDLETARTERSELDQASPDYDRMRSLLDQNIELLERRQELSEEEYERRLAQLRDDLDDSDRDYEDEIEDLEDELREARRNIQDAEDEVRDQYELDRAYLRSLQSEMTDDEYDAMIAEVVVDEEDTFFERLIYNHTDAFVGYGFGDDGYGAFLLGARPSFHFAGSKVFFSPEVALGVGSETTFNILGNAIFDLSLNSAAVEPYLGFGAGFIAPDGNFKPAYNMIFGTQLNQVMEGKLNVEFAGRNLFKYNQLTVGYELF